MGWKSTIDITRREAIDAIIAQINFLENKSNDEIENMLSELNFGDDPDKPWFGHNFIIIDD
jgi:hypothetical protein